MMMWMPGEWAAQPLARLANQLQQAVAAAVADGGSQLQCVPIVDAEVQWPLQWVDLGDC